MSRATAAPSDRQDAPPSTVDQLLEIAARGRPDARAIVAPGRPPLPYGRFRRHVQHVIATLNASGIGHGDRVAVALPQGPDMAVAVLAVAVGATCTPLNPTHRTRECAALLGCLRARALVIQAGTDSPAWAAAASQGIPIIELSRGPRIEAGLVTLRSSQAREPVRPVSPRPDDIALLLPTSGTTAGPKLVPLSHSNLCASAHSMRTSLSLGPIDRCLNLMPLFHVHGFMALLASLAAGADIACPPAFDAARVLEWIDECHPTWYTAVPAMPRAILGRAERQREVTTRHRLRFIRSASAALPERVQAGLERVFGAPVIQAYGMTEAAHQIATTPLPPTPAGGAAGGRWAAPRGPRLPSSMDPAARSRPAKPARSRFAARVSCGAMRMIRSPTRAPSWGSGSERGTSVAWIPTGTCTSPAVSARSSTAAERRSRPRKSLASRISEASGVELPLRRIFETPTVAAIARAVVQAGAESAEDPAEDPHVGRIPVGVDGGGDGTLSAEGIRDRPGPAGNPA